MVAITLEQAVARQGLSNNQDPGFDAALSDVLAAKVENGLTDNDEFYDGRPADYFYVYNINGKRYVVAGEGREWWFVPDESVEDEIICTVGITEITVDLIITLAIHSGIPEVGMTKI